jgi:hypothetical protein
LNGLCAEKLLEISIQEDSYYMVHTLIVANHREFFSPLDSVVPEAELSAWRNDDFLIAERAIFWGGDDKLVILPQQVSEEFQSSIVSSMGWYNLRVIAPSTKSNSICKDIYSDQQLWFDLVSTLRQSDQVELFSYGTTPQLYELLKNLRDAGLTIQTPELASKHLFNLIHSLDSKSGCRELAAHLAETEPEIKLPAGYLCYNRDDINTAIYKLSEITTQVVLKLDRGAGGWGIVKLTELSSSLDAALAALGKEPEIWRSGPIIVEEYIDTADSPTVDAVVLPDGSVEPRIIGRQVLDARLRYMGIHVGHHIYSPELTNRIYQIGQTIGNEMGRLGYRGWFDIDLIRTKNDELYVIEINARRTGVTHVWEILRKIGIQGQVVVAYDGWLLLDKSSISVHDIMVRLGPPQQGSSGTLLTTSRAANIGQNAIGYFAWSDSNEGLRQQLNRLRSAADQGTNLLGGTDKSPVFPASLDDTSS